MLLDQQEFCYLTLEKRLKQQNLKHWNLAFNLLPLHNPHWHCLTANIKITPTVQTTTGHKRAGRYIKFHLTLW